MRVFLIGYMGCGKTTIGQSLAARLNYRFIDMDSFLVEKHGKSVPEIFAREGESRFREFERDVLSDLFQLDNIVVATGGGAPCFFDNIDRMNMNGTTVYLQVTVDELLTRLKSQTEERPLVRGKSGEELKSFITQALSKREPFYLKAKIVFPGDVNQVFGLQTKITE